MRMDRTSDTDIRPSRCVRSRTGSERGNKRPGGLAGKQDHHQGYCVRRRSAQDRDTPLTDLGARTQFFRPHMYHPGVLNHHNFSSVSHIRYRFIPPLTRTIAEPVLPAPGRYDLIVFPTLRFHSNAHQTPLTEPPLSSFTHNTRPPTRPCTQTTTITNERAPTHCTPQGPTADTYPRSFSLIPEINQQWPPRRRLRRVR